MFEALRAAVLHRLESGYGLQQWTMQGFGMIRTYLDVNQRWRLNIWNPDLAVPGVSTIHDHPWHFTSYILSGQITNIRYLKEATGFSHQYIRIRTGEDGGLTEAGGACMLRCLPDWNYRPGESYRQVADAIHETRYSPGTVTLNDRSKAVNKDYSARVFWPKGEDWVDAKPRRATWAEIDSTIKLALSWWNQL